MPFITHALYFCILLSSLLFFISYFREPRRIQNGLFFLLSYFSITSFICLFTAEFLPASTLQSILFYISIGLFSLPIIVFSFILALSILIFLITDIILVFREGLKKNNLLSFGFGLLLLFWITVLPKLQDIITHPLLRTMLIFFTVTLFYFLFNFFIYSLSAVLYHYYKPRRMADFIIVLGAGLRKDKVTPLLASRIDCAIDVYRKQCTKGHETLLVMSGGQGHDEEVAEAIAMKDYAISQGIPEHDILCETQSRTTYENFRLSKQCIQLHLLEKGKKTSSSVLFATNRYHVFRSALIAKSLGLPFHGIGSKTKLYFALNAFIREYIAILVRYKRFYLTFLVLIYTLLCCIFILEYHFDLSL